MSYTVHPDGTIFDNNSFFNDPLGYVNGQTVFDPLGNPNGTYNVQDLGNDQFYPDNEPYKVKADQFDVFKEDPLEFDPLKDFNKGFDFNFKSGYNRNSGFGGGFNF